MLVKEYCKEHDIVYREHFFIEGWVNSAFQPKKKILSADLNDRFNRNQHVLSTLRDVANQLNLLKKVADKEIDERMGRRRN